MARVKIAENKQDFLRNKLGSGRSIENYNFAASRITVSELTDFSVQMKDRTTLEENGIVHEVQTIELKSLTSENISSLIARNLNLDMDFTDHFSTINIPQHVSQIETMNLNKTAASYNVITKFNYSANDYDESIKNTSETLLAPIFQVPFDAPEQLLQKIVLPNQTQDPFERPYYNEVSIKNNITNDFVNFLRKTELFTSVLNDYLKGEKVSIPFNVQAGTNASLSEVQVFDLINWINSDSFESDLFDPQSGEDSQMIRAFKKYLFLGYVRQLSKNFRSFSDLLNNDECYVEDFCYSIDKFKDVAVEPKLQEIYIPAVDNITSFYDTQIKYGQKYVYNTKVHYVVIGNTYRYTNLRFNNDVALVDVVNRPTVMIVPFDLFSETVRVIQPPSLPPHVRFSTKNNSENKILISLSPTKGSIRDDFTVITQADEVQLAQMKENKTRNSTGFRFSTEREDGLYEIYKLKEPPESYLSFIQNKLIEIGSPYMSEDAKFVDKVQPNTKYYYMFRKINSKGLVSNPTAVYEVELLIDADESRVLISEYSFPEPPSYQMTKTFKSMFQVTPAIDQTFFNELQTPLYNKTSYKNTVQDLKLGVATQAVWGRKFKIRVRSTTTGKIIDYNVTFKLTKNKSEEEF